MKILLLPLLLLGFAASAATPRAQLLEAKVEYLSDSLCAGRGCGSTGACEAAGYILRSLRREGIEPRLDLFEAVDAEGRRVGVGRNIVVDSGSKSVVVVVAYYDGLGLIDGRFFPGADSNASGVAALLELCPKLGDGFLVAFLDGHSCNYAGARRLLGSLKGRTVRQVIALDCMGSTLAPVFRSWPNFMIALGADRCMRKGRSCRDVLIDLGDTFDLHLNFDYYQSRDFTRLFYGKIGDHTVFLNAGMPVIVFTSGITMNTNKTTDTAATLDYPVFARRVELIEEFLKGY